MKQKKKILLLLLVVFCLGIMLSILRYPGSDESYYLRETTLISNCFKDFQWIGNEMVGVHGFLFKIPVALVFLITGPSVFVATIVNVLFGLLIIYLCYIIFLKITNSWEWATAGSFLLATNVYFLRVLPSYLREYPVMLSLLLFIYFILKRKSDILVALSLLLILDAKEGVFLLILPAFLAWLIYDELLNKKGVNFFGSIRNIFKRGIIVFSPVLIYVSLMIFTNVIPLNPVLTSYIGLNKGGVSAFMEYQVINVQSQYKYEIVEEKGNEKRESQKKNESSKNILQIILNVFFLYMRKIFYLRTFSLTSMSRFIILPALIFSFIIYRNWSAGEKKERILLVFIFWFYLAAYILRVSHGRYLLPIAPIIILFFILFLKEGIEQFSLSKYILVSTLVFVAIGLYFEEGYVVFKILINFFILTGLFLILYLHKNKYSSVLRLKWGLILLIGIFTFNIQIASSLILPGQIGKYKILGYCGEIDKLSDNFKSEENLWINIDTNLFKFYFNDLKLNFHEHGQVWELDQRIPKYKKLNWDRRQYVYTFGYNQTQFLKKLKERNIHTVALVIFSSKNNKFAFRDQSLLTDFKELTYLIPKEVIKMKNKEVYVFRVVY